MVDETPNWTRSIPKGQSWGGCLACKHFRYDMTCAAYPERIPIRIASGEIDHLVVRPGQIGDTVFDLNPDPDDAFRRRAVERARTAGIGASPAETGATMQRVLRERGML